MFGAKPFSESLSRYIMVGISLAEKPHFLRLALTIRMAPVKGIH